MLNWKLRKSKPQKSSNACSFKNIVFKWAGYELKESRQFAYHSDTYFSFDKIQRKYEPEHSSPTIMLFDFTLPNVLNSPAQKSLKLPESEKKVKSNYATSN